MLLCCRLTDHQALSPLNSSLVADIDGIDIGIGIWLDSGLSDLEKSKSGVFTCTVTRL